MVYDTALRIGAKMALKPKRIYLHSGARAGAKVLGLNYHEDTLDIADVPRVLQQLDAHEIEDCLCIYKPELARLANKDLQPTAARKNARRRG
jgi:hypothetical protein